MAVRIQPYSGLSGGFCPGGQSVVLLFYPTHSALGRGFFCLHRVQVSKEETLAFRTHHGYRHFCFPICQHFAFFADWADEMSIE